MKIVVLLMTVVVFARIKLEIRARLFKTNDVSLKFQTLISKIRQYFLLKKCEKLLQLLSFFQRKISVYLVIKS